METFLFDPDKEGFGSLDVLDTRSTSSYSQHTFGNDTPGTSASVRLELLQALQMSQQLPQVEASGVSGMLRQPGQLRQLHLSPQQQPHTQLYTLGPVSKASTIPEAPDASTSRSGQELEPQREEVPDYAQEAEDEGPSSGPNDEEPRGAVMSRLCTAIVEGKKQGVQPKSAKPARLIASTPDVAIQQPAQGAPASRRAVRSAEDICTHLYNLHVPALARSRYLLAHLTGRWLVGAHIR